MNSPLARQAGNALSWKAVQHLGSRAIGLVQTLILARLLVPDDFGIVAIAVATVGMFCRVTDLGLTPALVQSRDVGESHYNSAWTIGLWRAVAVSVVLILAAPVVATVFAEPRATTFLRVMAIRPLLEAFASIKAACLIRDLRFRSLAFITLIGVVIELVVAITFVSSIGIWAIAVGGLVGTLVSTLCSYWFAPHRPRIDFNYRAIQPLIRFGRWIFMIGLSSVAGAYVIQIVVSRHLGTAELGFYFLAMKIAFIPSEIASDVVGGVTFPIFSRFQDDRARVAAVFAKALIGVTALLLPTYIMMIVLAPGVVTAVIGPQWIGIEPLLRVLAVAGVLGIFGDVAVPLLKGLGKPNKVMMLEITQSCLIILCIVPSIRSYGLVGAAAAWLPAVFVAQFLSLRYVRRELPALTFPALPPLFGIVLAATLSGLLCGATQAMVSGKAGFVLSAIVGTIGYLGFLGVVDRVFSINLGRDLCAAFPIMVRLPQTAPDQGDRGRESAAES